MSNESEGESGIPGARTAKILAIVSILGVIIWLGLNRAGNVVTVESIIVTTVLLLVLGGIFYIVPRLYRNLMISPYKKMGHKQESPEVRNPKLTIEEMEAQRKKEKEAEERKAAVEGALMPDEPAYKKYWKDL